ncbi:MAG: GNAT family N-acetyltransferase [Halodesulfurarchaeum sp.]
MEFAVLGWPEDEVQLDLDHRRFAYAGKFVMTNTGKAVAREDGAVVAAISFNADRTEQSLGWFRYVTVAEERQGEEIGPRLANWTASHLLSERFDRIRIAVNNPVAYHALYKAGFGFTGKETGIAEVVLERPADRDSALYVSGLERFMDRDFPPDMESFLRKRLDAGTPPPPISSQDEEAEG